MLQRVSPSHQLIVVWLETADSIEAPFAARSITEPLLSQLAGSRSPSPSVSSSAPTAVTGPSDAGSWIGPPLPAAATRLAPPSVAFLTAFRRRSVGISGSFAHPTGSRITSAPLSAA
jgi:hypothetical protein